MESVETGTQNRSCRRCERASERHWWLTRCRFPLCLPI